MKRLSALVLLAASAAAAFCQKPNKQLQGLEEYLRQQGFSSYREQSSTWGKGITHKLGAGFHFKGFHLDVAALIGDITGTVMIGAGYRF